MTNALTRGVSVQDEAYARPRLSRLARAIVELLAKTRFSFAAALHESRRNQAARFIHDNKHLSTGE